MEREEFIREVQLNVLRNHALRLSEAEAASAIEATLEMVGQQLTPAATRSLAEKLPAGVAELVEGQEMDQSLTPDSFLESVANRESVDLTVATYYVRAVLATLGQLLSAQELDNLRKQFPAELQSFLTRGSDDEVEAAL
jgi:uncharacterized protein (DUF2267 family)